MSYHFDILHNVQCVAHLLKKTSAKQHNYTAILKMLYLADRESIAESGSPVTGDRPFAMDKGPVLSETLDLIKGNGPETHQAIWDRYLETRGHEIALLMDPGMGRLCEHDVEILDKIHAEHGRTRYQDLIALVHDLPEWSDTYQENTSTPISLRAILKALDKEDQYDELSQRKIEDAYFAQMFEG